jgi:RNA polymerase-binding transcription factor DksA
MRRYRERARLASARVTNDERHTAIDLEAVEADLTDVEIALERLEQGTYFVDEVTGDEIPATLLEERPTRRRV